MRRALIIDVDGTIMIHHGVRGIAQWDSCIVLSHAIVTFERMSHEEPRPYVILITGRPESYRASTESSLRRYGIWWDVLLMGVPSEYRLLIGDGKVDAIPIDMNQEWRPPWHE